MEVQTSAVNGAAFNLLHEPWIRVLYCDGTPAELSILEIFAQAHRIRQLAGEIASQDAAVARFLLAILHATFGKQEDGTYRTFPGATIQPRRADDMYERWRALWNARSFPVNIIRDYLLNYEDRFWLFHPEKPFYQVVGVTERLNPTFTLADLDKSGSPKGFFPASKLNGELLESNNKVRLFPARAGDEKRALSYAEAARWLLHLNGYDDSALKKAKNERPDLPSVSKSWQAQLGFIMVTGDTLFETLLLNFVLWKIDGNKPWGVERPIWALENVRSEQLSEINVPDNQSALLTLQTRRIELIRDEEGIRGYFLLGGDFFNDEAEKFNEMMTVWRTRVIGKTKRSEGTLEYRFRLHRQDRQIWRDLPALIGADETAPLPGVVEWVRTLQHEYEYDDELQNRFFGLWTVGIEAGGPPANLIKNIFSSQLTITAQLLSEKELIGSVKNILDRTDKLVFCAGLLADDLAKASKSYDSRPRSNDREIAGKAREEVYFRLDMPFRNWLTEYNTKNYLEKDVEWLSEAKRIIRSYGNELVEQCGTSALVGRQDQNSGPDNSGTGDKNWITAAMAFNRFLWRLNKYAPDQK